jgi:hypothetical protein
MAGLRKRVDRHLRVLRSCPFAERKGYDPMLEITQLRCNENIVTRMPTALRAAVERAAPSYKISEYVRRALLAQLRADGALARDSADIAAIVASEEQGPRDDGQFANPAGRLSPERGGAAQLRVLF